VLRDSRCQSPAPIAALFSVLLVGFIVTMAVSEK
jgi:hypothetical protein